MKEYSMFAFIQKKKTLSHRANKNTVINKQKTNVKGKMINVKETFII